VELGHYLIGGVVDVSRGDLSLVDRVLQVIIYVLAVGVVVSGIYAVLKILGFGS